MRTPIPVILKTIFIASGMLLFVLSGAMNRLPLLIAALLFILLTLISRQTRNDFSRFLLPLAAGWLLLPMRLFYWDAIEFTHRSGWLLGIALISMLLYRWSVLGTFRRWESNFLKMKKTRQLLTIFLISGLLYSSAALIITERGVRPAGDEPHYLSIAHSIARDFDLNIFNQHFRNLYKEFLPVESLPAHGAFGRGYKKIYSNHLPGLAVTLSPFFLFRMPPKLLYPLTRICMGLYGALLALLVFLFSLRIWKKPRLSLGLTLLFSLTSPILFYSIHLFPEIQALLMLLGALYLILFPGSRPLLKTATAGFLLGALLFWGVKYSLFTYLYVAGFAVYFLCKKQWKRMLALISFPLVFQGLFFYYLWFAYGTFSPQAVYYGMMNAEQSRSVSKTLFQTITMRMRIETLLDYFFDQRDGLLPYNPLYFFAFPGILLALKHWRKYKFHLLIASPAILFILYHAFTTIRPGFCPQARYLVPAIWMMLLFAAIYYLEQKNRWFARLLPMGILYALFVSLFQMIQPATLYQPTTHDILQRPALIFQQWSNLYIDLSRYLPSFVKIENSRYWPNYLWLLLFCAGIMFMLIRSRPKSIRIGLVTPFLIILPFLLFPRPGLFNPTLIDRSSSPDENSYFLYERNPFPGAQDDGTRSLTKTGTHSFLLGSPKRSFSVSLSLKNKSTNQVHLRVICFDRTIGTVNLPEGENLRLTLPLPKGRAYKNHMLYSLHLVLNSSYHHAENTAVECNWSLLRTNMDSHGI